MYLTSILVCHGQYRIVICGMWTTIFLASHGACIAATVASITSFILQWLSRKASRQEPMPHSLSEAPLAILTGTPGSGSFMDGLDLELGVARLRQHTGIHGVRVDPDLPDLFSFDDLGCGCSVHACNWRYCCFFHSYNT